MTYTREQQIIDICRGFVHPIRIDFNDDAETITVDDLTTDQRYICEIGSDDDVMVFHNDRDYGDIVTVPITFIPHHPSYIDEDDGRVRIYL